MDGTTVSRTRTRLTQAEPSNAVRPVGKPTIRAVAEHAKVAISTVSRVVNGGPVSEDVRQRVNLAIETLGYTPSIAAQSLVGRKANCVGLVTDSTQSRWFSQILLGIETALAPSRKSLQLSSLMLSGSYNASQVRSWITERRVDGLIFVRSTKASVELVAQAQEHGLPVALIGPDLEQQAACIIRGNNVDAGRLAAEHLADLGHRRIGFAGGPEVSYDTRMRLRGASERLAERGCDPTSVPPAGRPASTLLPRMMRAAFCSRSGPISATGSPCSCACRTETLALVLRTKIRPSTRRSMIHERT